MRISYWSSDVCSSDLHEGQSVVDLVRFQLRRHRGFGRAPVRPMRAHAIVQGSPTGRKPFGLRVVRAVNEAHELAHYIAVEPRWAKRVLSHQPARSEEHTSELQSLMRTSYAVFCLKKK